jgi:hypothetical protein
LSSETVTRINRAIKEQISPEAMLPSHVRVRLAKARQAVETAGPTEEAALRFARNKAEEEASNYPDAQEFALDLVERIERARRTKMAFVKILLPQYGANDFASRKFIAGEIKRIALTLRKFLPNQAKSVHTIVIIFGTGNLATRQEVTLR